MHVFLPDPCPGPVKAWACLIGEEAEKEDIPKEGSLSAAGRPLRMPSAALEANH